MSGELGNGATTDSPVPVQVLGLQSGAQVIAAGGRHACALVNGSAKCWGRNGNGELGTGSTTDSSVPVQVAGLTNGVQAIATGDYHTCSLVNGGVQCLGYDHHGELGNGSTTDSAVPVQVSGLTTGVQAVAGGSLHTCALVNGDVECWGYNDNGQLGNGSTTDSSVPVQVRPWSLTSKDPLIPAITGTCPTFMNGSIDYLGLGGIEMQVGAMKQGTGSLIFYWHGTGSTAAESSLFGGTQEVLDSGGIIISPQRSTGMGGDCSVTATFSVGDFDVTDQIAACAVRDYHIDPRSIYTTGCDAGGLQAGCMGLMRSSYIAAVVTNSGGVVSAQASQSKDHVPSVMTMHGAPSSDVVIVDFSDTSRTYDDAIKMAGGFVVNCNHGGGHCGAPADLQAAGWQFMRAHPFGVSPEPYVGGLPSSFPSYCTVY
jgi:hypothetical protein